MQQQRAGQVLGEIQLLVDADSVIADGGVGLVTDRGQVGEESAPAVAHHADAAVAAGRMLAQKVDGGGDVVGDLVVIHLAAEGAGFLEFGLLELDIGLGAPEQIGADRGELAGGEEIANLAHAFADAEDLLEHDDSGALALLGEGHVGGHFAARYGDSNGHKAP